MVGKNERTSNQSSACIKQKWNGRIEDGEEEVEDEGKKEGTTEGNWNSRDNCCQVETERKKEATLLESWNIGTLKSA